MLNKVVFTTQRGATLELPLVGSLNGYTVRDIEGLDPSKAQLISSSFALLAGEQYQTSHTEKRNLVFKLGYDLGHSQSVFTRRQNLYSFFMPGSELNMKYYIEGIPVVELNGVAEDCDSPMFTDDPQATIIVVAHQPYFTSLDTFVLNSTTTASPRADTLTYRGSVPTGFTYSMLLNRSLTRLTINHNFSNGVGSSFEFAGNMLSGDLIEFETVDGNKGAYSTRNGIRQSVLYGVSPSSNWIDLYPGDNTLRVYADGPPIPYTIEYRERYGGL